MGMLRSLSLVLSLLTVLLAMAHGCCNPDQFEANVGVTSVKVKAGKGSISQSLMDVSYDYTNKRMQETSWLMVDNVYTQRKIITKDAKVYEINLSKKTCVVIPSTPLKRSCIPDGAVYVATFRLGIGESSFLSDSYEYKPTQFSGKVNIAVIKDNCMYLNVLDYSEGADIATTARGFFNATLGIRDPSVFDVPSYCTTSSSNAEGSANDHASVPEAIVFEFY